MTAREALTLVRREIVADGGDEARYLALLLTPPVVEEPVEFDEAELLAARRAAIESGQVTLV